MHIALCHVFVNAAIDIILGCPFNMSVLLVYNIAITIMVSSASCIYSGSAPPYIDKLISSDNDHLRTSS